MISEARSQSHPASTSSSMEFMRRQTPWGMRALRREGVGGGEGLGAGEGGWGGGGEGRGVDKRGREVRE